MITRNEYKEYPGFTLYPFYSKKARLPWAAAAVIQLDKIEKLIFVSGTTGRDMETDIQPENWEEERHGSAAKVVGGIREQTRACWMRIKEVLEEVGANLEDLYQINFFLVDREDWFDMWDETHKFYSEYCPDIHENPRASVLIRGGIRLDLPDMLIEIEVAAAVAKK